MKEIFAIILPTYKGIKNKTYLNQENNTFFVGKVLQQHEELHSTNQYALDLLAKTPPIEGTVILANSQSAGRGQMGLSLIHI